MGPNNIKDKLYKNNNTQSGKKIFYKTSNSDENFMLCSLVIIKKNAINFYCYLKPMIIPYIKIVPSQTNIFTQNS